MSLFKFLQVLLLKYRSIQRGKIVKVLGESELLQAFYVMYLLFSLRGNVMQCAQLRFYSM